MPRPRRTRLIAAVVGTLLVLVATAQPASAAAPLEGVRHFDHIAVLTLENEDASDTFGPTSPALYLNGLLGQGTFLPNYYATSHVSLGNYITMMSGLSANPATTSDCLSQNLYECVATVTAQQPTCAAAAPAASCHLGDQLERAGLTWAGYMDGYVDTSARNGDCFHASYSQTAAPPDPYQGNAQAAPGFDYADRHNPWIYFSNVIGDDARCLAHEHPYSRLASDLAANALPSFSFVTPDTCHDGHDTPCSKQTPQSADRAAGGLTAADAWLRHEIPPLLTYLRSHNGLLIINFDEGNPTTTGQEVCSACAGGGVGGRTGAVLLGAGIQRGVSDVTDYDHASLLRTIEDSFGISEHLTLAGTPNAKPMTTALVEAPDAVVPEAPWLPALAVGAALAAAAFVVLRRRRGLPG